MKAQEVRPGMVIGYESQTWQVVTTEHVKPGKGPAYVQVKLKNMQTGSHIERRLRSGEDIDQVDVEKRPMEYLYTDSTGAVFMDTTTYDQIPIPLSVLGEVIHYIKPNTPVVGTVIGGNVIAVDPPAQVELEVVDTPPGVKDATKTGQVKEAKLETGLVIRVPAFIKVGEIVCVSTLTGEYMGRAGN
ncbi:MAG: elongation factor P [Phycisphaeraceae bacterium]|nr:elongation factor P [Phycisphaeraceae bacterium]